jgi:hypothetical protein
MEMREWRIKKVWNYYVRQALDEDVLLPAWKDDFVPTKKMLTREPEL